MVLACSPAWGAAAWYLQHRTGSESTGLARSGVLSALELQWRHLGGEALGAGRELWDVACVLAVAVLAVHVVVAVVYETACTRVWGRTPGKMAVGLVLVPRPGVVRAFARAVLVVGLPAAAWVAFVHGVLRWSVWPAAGGVALLAATTAYLATWRHDGWARTAVVHAQRRQAF